MNKIYSIILAAAALATAASCSELDTDLDTIVPAEYDRILTLKSSGVQSVTMSVAETRHCYDLAILKGGLHKEFAAEAMLEVLTQEEVDATYNDKLGTRYRVLSAGMYTVTDYHMTIGREATGRSVVVAFNAPRIYAAMSRAEESGSTFVLPVRLTSPSDSVNVSGNEVLLTCAVAPATVSMELARERVQLPSDEATATVDFDITKTGEVTTGLSFSVKSQEELDRLYSGPEGIDYTLIPADCYTMAPEAEMAADAVTLTHGIDFDIARVKAFADEHPSAVMALPLTLRSLSPQALVDRSDMLLICGFHTYESEELYDKTGWSVAYGTVCIPACPYRYMFDCVEDGNGWMGYINDGFPGSQNLGDPYVVIDMGTPSIFSEFGVQLGDRISGGFYDTHPAAVEFYVTAATDLDPQLTPEERAILEGNSGYVGEMGRDYIDLHERLRQFDAGVEWVKVSQVGPVEATPAAVGQYWGSVAPSFIDSRISSRYVKMVVRPGTLADRSKIHEFYARRIVRIDGESVL